MLIAIISDIHDNLVNLTKCLDWCQANDVDEIICCGDVTNGETLKTLASTFTKEIHLVKGNMELYKEKEVLEYENITYYSKAGWFDIDGKTIGACHEPFYLEEIIRKEKCDIIFYGHTHKPWEEQRNSIKIINPGNVAGVLHKATFATWNTETDELELKILEQL